LKAMKEKNGGEMGEWERGQVVVWDMNSWPVLILGRGGRGKKGSTKVWRKKLNMRLFQAGSVMLGLTFGVGKNLKREEKREKGKSVRTGMRRQ